MNELCLFDESSDIPNPRMRFQVKERKGWGYFSRDPLGAYNTICPGLTRTELSKKYPGLYQALRKTGELDHIPKIWDIGRPPKKRLDRGRHTQPQLVTPVEPVVSIKEAIATTNVSPQPIFTREKLGGLKEFLTLGFSDKNFQLEPVPARSDTEGNVYLCSFSLGGRRYTARVHIDKPDTDVQLRTVYFHEGYGWLLGAYENNGSRNEFLRMFRTYLGTENDCLRTLWPYELFSIGQEVRDSRHGKGEVIDVTRSRVIAYFRCPTIGNVSYKPEMRGKSIGPPLRISYPFDYCLQVLSIV